MAEKQRILIVDDDENIAELISLYLMKECYETYIVNDGEEALKQFHIFHPDLILLDLMLPGKNGYDICREIRDKVDVPILMVTARTESIDKVLGLGLGADDYISKPFDPAELVARVKSHLNRYERLTKNGEPQNGTEGREKDVIKIDGIEIHTRSWKVFRDGEEIRFPNREFELLKFLAMNPNIVFSKEELFEKIWGYDYVGDSVTVTVHINRIREKIEEDSKNPKIIETVWGAGYRLNR